jgi:hypothetical protein
MAPAVTKLPPRSRGALTGTRYERMAGTWPQASDNYIIDSHIYARQMACRGKR